MYEEETIIDSDELEEIDALIGELAGDIAAGELDWKNPEGDGETGPAVDNTEGTEEDVPASVLAEGDLIIAEALAEYGLIGEGRLLEITNPYKNQMERMTKTQKLGRVTAKASFVVAKQRHDPDMVKLEKLNRVRIALKKKIEKKYSTLARKRVKDMLNKEHGFASVDQPNHNPNAKAY
jgi:hypothetical protein